jgi:hypothetical protein
MSLRKGLPLRPDLTSNHHRDRQRTSKLYYFSFVSLRHPAQLLHFRRQAKLISLGAAGPDRLRPREVYARAVTPEPMVHPDGDIGMQRTHTGLLLLQGTLWRCSQLCISQLKKVVSEIEIPFLAKTANTIKMITITKRVSCPLEAEDHRMPWASKGPIQRRGREEGGVCSVPRLPRRCGSAVAEMPGRQPRTARATG